MQYGQYYYKLELYILYEYGTFDKKPCHLQDHWLSPFICFTIIYYIILLPYYLPIAINIIIILYQSLFSPHEIFYFLRMRPTIFSASSLSFISSSSPCPRLFSSQYSFLYTISTIDSYLYECMLASSLPPIDSIKM